MRFWQRATGFVGIAALLWSAARRVVSQLLLVSDFAVRAASHSRI